MNDKLDIFFIGLATGQEIDLEKWDEEEWNPAKKTGDDILNFINNGQIADLVNLGNKYGPKLQKIITMLLCRSINDATLVLLKEFHAKKWPISVSCLGDACKSERIFFFFLM